MQTRLLTAISMAHAIAMILFAVQYQSIRSNKVLEETLQQHTAHLEEQINTAQIRLTQLQDPEYIREYATHALGMQEIHASQQKQLSDTQIQSLTQDM